MIFINHVPKCGGTTLSALIEACFDVDRIISGASLQNKKLISRSERHSLRYLPESMIASAGLITGHMGEGVRERLPDVYSVIVLREPAARVRSLLRHHVARPAAFANLAPYVRADGHVDVSEPGFIAALRSLSMLSFLSPKFYLFAEADADMGTYLPQALAALDAYDLVLTEETFDALTDFLRSVVGAPPDRIRVRLNESESLLSAGERLQWSDEIEQLLRQDFPEEFSLYEHGVALSRRHLQRVVADPMRAVDEARGRIGAKSSAWRLDWNLKQRSGGWSERREVGIAELASLSGRTIAAAEAFVEAPLESGRYEARFTMWFSEPFDPEAFAITCNGQPLTYAVTLPEAPNPFLVVLSGELAVPVRPSWTRFGFSYAARDARRAEAWLIEMVARK